MKCNIHFKCLFFVDLDDSLFTTAAGERRKIIIRRANVLTGKHLRLRPATKIGSVCLFFLFLEILKTLTLPRP